MNDDRELLIINPADAEVIRDFLVDVSLYVLSKRDDIDHISVGNFEIPTMEELIEKLKAINTLTGDGPKLLGWALTNSTSLIFTSLNVMYGDNLNVVNYMEYLANKDG